MKASPIVMPTPAAPETEIATLPHLDDVLNSRMDRLRLRHLRLLDTVARTGSLSAAAEALGMSQPGATKMLQELELAFTCKLIERSAKGGELTDAGRHVLDRMRIALHSLRAARTAVDLRKEMPLIRLGIIPLVGIHALSHVVGAMQAEKNLPRLQIQLGTVEGLLQALGEGRVDCVVGFLDETTSESNLSGLRVMPLWQEKLVTVASNGHPLASLKQVSIELARDCDWVMMPKASSNRRVVERLFLTAGLVPPTPQIETESFHIGLSLVAGSRLLAAVPESAYLQYQAQVSILPMAIQFPSTTLVFMTRCDGPLLPSVEMISQRFQTYSKMLESPNLPKS